MNIQEASSAGNKWDYSSAVVAGVTNPKVADAFNAIANDLKSISAGTYVAPESSIKFNGEAQDWSARVSTPSAGKSESRSI